MKDESSERRAIRSKVKKNFETNPFAKKMRAHHQALENAKVKSEIPSYLRRGKK